ncbi:MAG: hypothetical protein ACLTYP_00525 [Eubacterium sp.]|jgi:hypothetical protein|uniref:hypothetical protein n=1 Tax=Eubacterium sp. TaxID=142586 RepID=UPI002626BDC7|nr:hypothetical protein [uncultured Eubacterium sp.]
MNVYHGTSKQKFEQILKDRKIKKNIAREYEDTKDGYVYLATNVIVAYYYGNIISMSENTEDVYILKINIDKKQLKVDTDEKRVVFRNKEMREFTVEDSINLLKTVRVDFDISFDKYDIEYTKISNTYNASPKEIEFLQKMCNAQTQKNLMTEELIKEAEERYEWIKL